MEYNKRIFNLGNISARVSRRQESARDSAEEYASEYGAPKIPKSIPDPGMQESPIGSFLIRIILCITVFSGIMLMKNSTDANVSIIYDAIRAWSTCSYSIPEEYGLEKFVDAFKKGSLQAVFSTASYPAIQFPSEGDVVVHYGDKSSDGATCLGIIIESTEQNNIFSSIDGTVKDIGENETLGKYISIENDAGVKIIYGCCDDIMVSIGDAVDINTVLAKMTLGKENKYYLYMEVQNNDSVVDPEKCFSESV